MLYLVVLGTVENRVALAALKKGLLPTHFTLFHKKFIVLYLNIYCFCLNSKMIDRASFKARLAKLISLLILQFSIHPAYYLLLFYIAVMQTCSAIAHRDSSIFLVLKWFDLANFVAYDIIVYVLIGPVLIATVLLLFLIITSSPSIYVERTVFSTIAIKALMMISITLFYATMFPLVQSSIQVIKKYNDQNNGFALVTIGGLQLGFYLFMICPIILVIHFQQSPASMKMYACMENINALLIFNLFRLVLSTITKNLQQQYTAIVVLLILPVIFGFLLKKPILMCRSNRCTQIGLSIVLFMFFVRTMELINGSYMPIINFIVGIPIFVLFILYILNKREQMILKQQKITIRLVKMLYRMMVNFPNYKSKLQQFLICHYRKCENDLCLCRKLIEHIKGAHIDDQTKEEKEEELKQNQLKLWYKFLLQIYQKHYNYEELKNIPTTQRYKRIQKIMHISMDKSEILHEKLKKRYLSLLAMWRWSAIMNKENFYYFPFQIRLYLHQNLIQMELKQAFAKGTGVQLYMWKYFNLQYQSHEFRVFLFKIASQIKQFWEEMCTKVPEESKIISLIQKIYKLNRIISEAYKKYVKNSKIVSGNSQYEKRWGQGSKALIDKYYIPYLKVISGKDNNSLIETLQKTLASFRKRQPQLYLSKDIRFFNTNSGTAMLLVSANQADNFGCIKLANIPFWTVIKSPRYNGLHFDHLTIKQMHQYHRDVMNKFLIGDNYFLNYITGFIYNMNGFVVELQFTAELVPNIYDGLQVAVFCQPVPQRCAFLMNKNSKLIAYTEKFHRQILTKLSLDDFDDIINKECVDQIDERKQMEIEILQIDYHIHCFRHRNYGKGENDKIVYFCQIKPLAEKSIKMPAMHSLDVEKIDQSIIEADHHRRSLKHSLHNETKTTLIAKAIQKKQKEKQTLRQIFNIVENDKKCRNIERWFVCMIVLLVLIGLISVGIIVTTLIRVHGIPTIAQEMQEYHDLMTSLADASYYARKINIKMKIGQNNHEMDVTKLKLINQRLQQSLKNTTAFSQDIFIDLMSTSRDNVVTIESQPLNALFLKYIIASYTYLSENPNNLSFDYIKTNIQVPYNSYIISFYNALYNNLYIAYPYMKDKRNTFLLDQKLCQIDCFKAQLGVILSIVGCFVCWAMVFITFCVGVKISLLKDFSFVLLSNFNEDKLYDKKNTIENYLEYELSDLNTKDISELKFSKLNKTSESFRQRTEQQFTQSVTQRSLFSEVNVGEKEEQFDKKKKKKLKIQSTLKKKMFAIFSLAGIPLFIIFCILISFQLIETSIIMSKFSIKTALDLRMEYLKIIKTLDQEVGLERDVTGYDPTLRLNLQLSNYIDELYQSQRNILTLIEKENGQLKSLFFSQSDQFTCKLVNESDVEVPNRVNKYSFIDCLNVFRGNFIDAGLKGVIIFYLSTSESIMNQYINAMSMSDQQLRYFVRDARHQTLERIIYFLEVLEEQTNLAFRESIKKESEKLKTSAIILMSLNFVILGLIFVLGIRNFKTWMYYDISLIKTVFHLLSYKEIEKDQKLEEMVLAHTDEFVFIK